MAIWQELRSEELLGEPAWDPETLGEMTVPDSIPDWLLDAPATLEEPRCDCVCTGPSGAAEPLRWAVPGVWDDEPVQVGVGALVGGLQDALARLEAADPAVLTEGQALAETEGLCQVAQRLRVQLLSRLQDVHERGLYRHDGFRTTRSWLAHVAPDAPLGDVTLAKRLPGLPHLTEALYDGRLSITAAGRIATTMTAMRPHLDHADGLIDGLPGDAVVAAVVDDTVDVVGRDRCGLDPDEPADAKVLAELHRRTSAIHAGGGSHADRLEQACVLRGELLTPRRLPTALEDVLLAVVPSLLEERDQRARDKRALSLSRNDDGSWRLDATLTPETGERLFTVLGAEARRDPANPLDTAARAEARAAAAQAAGRDDWGDRQLPAWEQRARRDGLEAIPDHDALVPRSRSRRLHDAFDHALSRYLSTGLAGVQGKVPVQVTVTCTSALVDGSPGARPARGSTGQALSRALLRAWWCNAHITTLMMGRGWTPLGVVHTARTITATEAKAARAQYDNRCAAEGCCPGVPDPLIPLVPHHVQGYATYGRTSLGETVLLCPTAHDDVHLGHKTLRLRDGRLLDENGWVV